MSCCNVIVLFLSALAIVCAVCANVFTMFKKSNDAGTVKQTLWHRRTTTNGVTVEETVSLSGCQQFKLFFQISAATSLGASGLGLIVVGLTISQLILGVRKRLLTCCTAFLIIMSFAACGVCVALLVYGYLKGYCQNEKVKASRYPPFKDAGYSIAESFYLICVACALFLITSLFQCCA